MNINSEPSKELESTISQGKNSTPLQKFWQILTAPALSIIEVGEKRSARLAASFLLAITFLNIAGGIARAPRLGFLGSFSGPIGSSLIVSVVAYFLSRTKWYKAGIFLFALSFSSLAYLSMIQGGDQSDFGAFVLIYVPLSLIVSSSFLSGWAVFLLVGLNVGAYLSITAFGVNLPANVGAQTGIVTVIGVVLILLTNFRDTTEKIRFAEIQTINQELEALSANLEQRVFERTQELSIANDNANRRSEQLTVIAELSSTITTAGDLDKLLPTIASFISEKLNYYHVGIFLNDSSNSYAVLRASNSPGGQAMLERGHKLLIGQEGIVGYAISRGKTQIALDVGEDAIYFSNPDLPDTHSEIAIPLRGANEVIGALDIQSHETNAFSTDDLAVFTTLADQVAVAIQNSQLQNETQTTLQSLQEFYREQTARDWKSFTRSTSLKGYKYDGVDSKPINANEILMLESEPMLSIPVRLRGQIIGKLKLKPYDKKRTLTDEEVSLVEATIERVALALEGARLLEDAQRRAAKERTISEGAAHVSQVSDIESILNATAEELERALGSSEVIIQLTSE